MIVYNYFTPNLQNFAPYFTKCPNCHATLTKDSFASQMLVFIPIAYLIAYHNLPLLSFVKTRNRPLVRRAERFGLKIGVLRFLIYAGCSVPIYYMNYAALALSEWAIIDGASPGRAYSEYFSQVVGVLVGVWGSIVVSSWIFVKCGLAVKSDFPEAQWAEEKATMASGSGLKSVGGGTKELGGF
jgi:hypothetical protein